MMSGRDIWPPHERISCQNCGNWSSSQERVEAEGMDYAEFLKKMKKDKRHLASWDILGYLGMITECGLFGVTG